MIHWVRIIKHVMVNQVQFVAASAPSPDELKHWVEIVKCMKDRQLSIVDRLTPLELNVARLENWVEVFKRVEDNQLPMVGRLAVLNPFGRPTKLEGCQQLWWNSSLTAGSGTRGFGARINCESVASI